MTKEEKISAINEIVTKLRDTKTGLNSLLNFVFSGIPKTAKPGTLHDFILKCAEAKKTNKNLAPADDTKFEKIKGQFNMFVIKKIHEYEDKNSNKNPADFKQDVLNTIIQNLNDYDDPQKDKTENIFNQPLTEEYNNMREALNNKPYIFMKYGISTSCANAAAAFAYEFKNKYDNQEICFLDTTRWSNLINGRVGHVVPCVKLDKDNWIMVEPLIKNKDNKVYKIIPKQDMAVGKSLEHLIDHHKGEPYMIVNISNTLPTNHQYFLQYCSRVKLEDAKKFLAQVAKEEYWSHDNDMRTKIERELDILSNLSEEAKKLEAQPDGAQKLQSIIEQRRQVQSMRQATQNAQQSLYQNLEETLVEFHKLFENSRGPRNLSEYAKAHNMNMAQAEEWKFALTVPEIIQEKIPANVIGCSARADVFSSLLRSRMVPHKIVLTARKDHLMSAQNAIAQGQKPNLIHGHQIIAVEINGKLRMFDPSKKALEFIDAIVEPRRTFQYNTEDLPGDYIITNVMSWQDHEKIKHSDDLQQAYIQILTPTQIQSNYER